MKRQRGLTLIEVLVTTVVIGAGLAVAAQALSTSLKAEVHANNSSRAARLLEGLLGMVEGGVLTLANASGDFTAEGAPDVSWSIEVVPTDQENLLECKISCKWTERGQEITESITRWLYQAPQAEGTQSSGAGQ